MKIKELPIDTINKISAGEVVVDSSSVIKELIENSIDANATKIQINLIESGKKSIEIIDNGDGIDKEDLINTIKRHATSKIFDEKDLFNISSMGFRGEALYSISSVSHFSLISKPKNQEIGYGIFVNDDDINEKNKNENKKQTKEKNNTNNIITKTIDNKQIEIKPHAINEGTKINVNDLFYNIPVRKKFLTSSTNTLKKIIEIIENYALINPNIDFILSDTKNNKKQEIINTINLNQIQRIEFFFELKKEDLYKFENKKIFNDFESDNNNIDNKKNNDNKNVDNKNNHNIEINGYISSPYKNFSTKRLHIFVNNRLIDYKIINDAIYNAHKTFLFVNRHPFVFLNIKVDSKDIDVNIHPSKKEIKYRFESTLYHFIYETIKTSLFENTNVREIKTNDINSNINNVNNNKITKNNIYNFENNKIKNENNIELSKNNKDYVDSKKETTVEDKNINNKNTIIKNVEKENINKNHYNFYQEKLTTNEQETNYNNTNKNNRQLKIIGVYHDTFFLIELNEELYIVDQHALEERLNYEKNMKEYKLKSISIQNLIEPIILELTNIQYLTAVNNKEEIEKFGFIIDEFGIKTIIIRSIPVILKKNASIDIFKELLENIDKKENNIKNLINKTLISMSCKESIKANNIISNEYIQNIFLQTLNLENPYQCPHGRPTMIKYSLTEIEKLFKRK